MIYFDVTRLLEWSGRYTGMEHVAYALAEALNKKGAKLVYFVPGLGFVDVGTDVIWKDRTLTYCNVRQGSLKQMLRTSPKKVFEELRRRRALRRAAPVAFAAGDSFFTSDGLWDRQDYIDAVIAVSGQGVKIIHLVHDIVPIVVPHLVHGFVTEAMTSYFKQVAPHIDVLVSISQNTQNDFKQAFGEYCKDGLVHSLFHHGDDVPSVEPLMPKALADVKDFILCVGTIEIRKNHFLLYQTYRLAAEKGIDLPPLVIIGRDGWLTEQALKLMRDDPAVKDKILFAGPAPDSEMIWCYQNCLFTVMPSYYEGWGLQVAQSLHYGKVVAASNAGPLPEVGGDLNTYYSPFSTDECLSALTLLLDNAERSRREGEIQQHYHTTTWEEAVDGVAKMITS